MGLDYSDLRRILRSHGEEVEGFVVTVGEFESALEEAIEEGYAPELNRAIPTGFIIDNVGRIWMDGFHVGWLNSLCGPTELADFANALGASLPAVVSDLPFVAPINKPTESKPHDNE